MRQPMKCKRCKTTENVSVFQNTFTEFPKGQYVYLCPKCYDNLKVAEFTARLNADPRM